MSEAMSRTPSRIIPVDEEIFVSTDVEADGPIPGPHSMLSFASAAYTADKELIGTFSANLECLPDAKGHPLTMKWWKTEPEAWAACRVDPEDPAKALKAYVKWVEKLPGKPVFVAYPAGFDFTFMFWYMMRFVGRCPFSWSALDIKTLAFAMTGMPYRKCIKPRLPQVWLDPLPHTHVALDDALEQGALFCNMLAELREQQKTLSELPGWRGAGLTANADAPVFGSAAARASAAEADAESPETGPGKDSTAHG
ncbi:exonuclease [Pandoraea apista]|uniref:Exonuclease n=2 Tax=Pandoraea apista TaxID=93218 RepID=A0A0G4JE70_9BURK|nr:exonuclease [Pandoraea apista]AVF38729.1 exonuclease [Pandoraea apista]OXS94828.1 exonuclease [Pandoraea apista]RRW96377.1 exonuclease [Pandoraea apista]RRX03571.1 exonuclease [Pandoraea apista]